MNYYTKKSIIGKITIVEESGFITNLFFPEKTFNSAHYELTKLLEAAFIQLEKYFEGSRKVFDLPLNPRGTIYQKKIWAILSSIPYGETRTYREIAELSGNSSAARAVGGANNKNPIPIIIPCHRVIGSNNSLTGYAGDLELKQKLLDIEKSNILKNLSI